MTVGVRKGGGGACGGGGVVRASASLEGSSLGKISEETFFSSVMVSAEARLRHHPAVTVFLQLSFFSPFLLPPSSPTPCLSSDCSLSLSHTPEFPYIISLPFSSVFFFILLFLLYPLILAPLRA